MGQIKFLSSIMMTILFSICIVAFATTFGATNNAEVLLSDDADYAGLQEDFVGDVRTFNVNSNTSSNTLFSTTQEAGDQSASSGGQFKVGITTALTGSKKVITVGFKKIFGQDTNFGIIFTLITSLLGIIATFYAWKAWKGNPD